MLLGEGGSLPCNACAPITKSARMRRVRQWEYATDVMCRNPEALAEVSGCAGTSSSNSL